MEIIGLLYIVLIWPAVVGWSAQKRSISLVEALAIGHLPWMMYLALL